MNELHKIQMLILRELLFNPNSRFSDLNIQGLSNDHFAYHIKVLIEEGYVTKDESKYSLTNKGKEFANMMDTDITEIEKQPKVAVIIVATKNINGKKHLLVQERTKEPYFGYYGFITGKIRFGEKVTETAMRELKEETGLEEGEVFVKRIVHDHVVLEDSGDLVEDKMFYVILIKNPKGELVDTKNGKNKWITVERFKKLKKKYYNEDNIYKISQSKGDMNFIEKTYFIREF
jgi:ADP-ribose pyrophosphatase YjhB (NUDIX family)